MPAKSVAQQRLIFARFGAKFAKAHHFDNKGPLPLHVRAHQARRKRRVRS